MVTRPFPLGPSDLIAICGLCGAMGAVIALSWSKRPDRAFWLFQCGGWLVYGCAKYILNPVVYSTVTPVAILVVLGFAASLGLREALRFLQRRGVGGVGLGAASFVLAPVASTVWISAFDLLTTGAIPLFGTPAARMQALSIIFKKGFVLLAWCGFYIVARLWMELAEERTRRLTSAEAATRAELLLLRYQINPHFLFNALNSIAAMVDVDRGRAKQMVRDLSSFFRHSLRGANGDVTLREELESIRAYLRIEKIRFEEHLLVEIRLDSRVAGVRVPALLLHPLVENAVKHGMQSSPRPLRLEIEAAVRGEALAIAVRNSGRWRSDAPPEESTHVGLENVRRRLAQAYAGRHAFTIAEEDGWVTARLELLPAEEEQPALLAPRALETIAL